MNHKVASVDYSDYFLSTMQSLLAHTVVLAFLFLTTDFLSGNTQPAVGKITPKVDIVQAVTIDEAAVVAEVQRFLRGERQRPRKHSHWSDEYTGESEQGYCSECDAAHLLELLDEEV